jgi:hypothetical protein
MSQGSAMGKSKKDLIVAGKHVKGNLNTDKEEVLTNKSSSNTDLHRGAALCCCSRGNDD